VQYKPTKRGGGGMLKVPVSESDLAQSHFAVGTQGSGRFRRFFLRTVARWDATANLQPVLARSIHGREDGCTLAADGKSSLEAVDETGCDLARRQAVHGDDVS